MIRPGWTYIDVAPDCHSQEQEWVLLAMLDAQGDPKPRFATWTPAQALAHVRNLAAERARRLTHETGCTK